MLILSRVCAEFHNAKGEVVFAVTPATRNLFVEAPDSIREDILFRLLINDGSLEAAVPEARRKMLEQEPTAGTDASGKAVKPEPAEKAEEKPEKAAKGQKAGKAAGTAATAAVAAEADADPKAADAK